MNTIDVIIVGSGIAGMSIAGTLLQNGKSFIIINQNSVNFASGVSAALINPFSAKGKTYTPEYKSFLEIALPFYNYWEQIFSEKIIKETAILNIDTARTIDVFLAQNEIEIMHNCFTADTKNIYSTKPIWKIDNQLLLHSFHSFLNTNNLLLNEYFAHKELIIHQEKIEYKNIKASFIIFCEGVQATSNFLFPALPFTRNRGEVLLLSIPELSQDYVYDLGIRLVPKGNGIFWCGSNHKWQFDNLLPDAEWRKGVESILHKNLKIPFEILEHIVAERPTTAGQKVIAAVHKEHQNIGIFNGLGTKGYAIAPYYATQLLQHMNIITAEIHSNR